MKKYDEMEMTITLKAARNAWVFLVVAVMIFSAVENIATGETPSVFFFGIISGLIFWLSKFIETYRLTKQREEDEE